MARITSNELNILGKARKLHFAILILFVLLIVFCIRWQVVEAARFNDISKGRTNSSELKSLRGTIYSSDGSTLAYSEPRFDLFIWMNDLVFFEEKGIQTREEFVNKISTIIEVTPEEFNAKIKEFTDKGSKWFKVADSLNKDQRNQIIALRTDKFPDKELSGYIFETTSQRIYPEGRLASHIIGLTNTHNDEIYGVGGIEESFDKVMRPVSGFITYEKDAIGQTVTASLFETVEPKNGKSVYTTIDKRLQKVVEEKIKWGVETYQASSGTAIIMDPKTGSIMALANFPDYDPNIREEKDPEAYGNSAILRPYEAGSIGKMMTLATAVDMGLVAPDTVILKEGHEGCEKIHNDLQPLCTWDKKPQPAMQAWECFQKSDNICFFHLSELIDRRDFNDYLSKFGVGVAAGIELGRGDSPGNLKRYTEWNVGDVAAFSYGHGYQVNAVQAIDYTAAIANYGVRMKPRIVEKVVDADGKEQEYKPIVVETVLSKETAETMAFMMNKNYEASFAPGEWYYNHLKEYSLGVKSGTALIANSTGYSNDINATFVGYDTSAERTFVMLIKLEKPQIPSYDRLAFYNVRPVWLETFAAVKDIIGVPKK